MQKCCLNCRLNRTFNLLSFFPHSSQLLGDDSAGEAVGAGGAVDARDGDDVAALCGAGASGSCCTLVYTVGADGGADRVAPPVCLIGVGEGDLDDVFCPS